MSCSSSSRATSSKSPINLESLLGHSITSKKFTQILEQIVQSQSQSTSPVYEPDEIKPYPDITYVNYRKYGISFQLEKASSSKIQAIDPDAPPPANWMNKLGDPHGYIISAIDVYNEPPSTSKSKSSSSTSSSAWTRFPTFPIQCPLKPSIQITETINGKDLVNELGEPDRKGGGEGPRKGNIGTWVEWSEFGLMVEWTGALGPNAWDLGATHPWKILTIFNPNSSNS